MKAILNLGFLFCLAIAAHAQDTSLYQGWSRIYPQKGKIIKKALLWRIDSSKVEYVYDGNLADIRSGDVIKIETPEYLLMLKQNIWIKIKYDVVVLETEEILQGFIHSVNSASVSFTKKGNRHPEKINYKSYVINHAIRENTETESTGVNKEAADSDTSDPNPMITKKFIRSDLIIKYTGDSIWCDIDLETENYIHYHIERRGIDKRFKIPRSSVRDIYKKVKVKYHDISQSNNDIIVTSTGENIMCIIDTVNESEILYHINKHGPDPRFRISMKGVRKFTNN